MKEGWVTKDFTEVVSLQEGPGIRKYEYEDGGYPMINVRCVQDGYIDMSKSRSANMKLATSKWKHFQVDEGDILFTISGTIGRASVVKKSDLPLLMNTSVVRFKSINENLDSTFLFHYVRSSLFVEILKGMSTGTAIQNVGPSHLKKMEVPIPPLSEQKKIVAILDKALADIALAKVNVEKNIHNSKELIQSIFSAKTNPDLNDWQNVTVQNVAKKEKGSMRTGPFGSQLLHKEFVDEGIAVLGIDNAVANEFQWRKERYITPEKFQQLSRFQVKPKDVLITIMGTCGRCAIVPEDIPIAINTKHLCCITLDQNKCLPEYLHGYFLYHPIAQKYLKKKAKGAIMAGLNMGIIKEMPLLLPSIAEQMKVTVILKCALRESQQYRVSMQKKLDNLEELKKSILQKAFAGELT